MSKKFIGSFDGSLLEDVDSFLKYYKDTYLCVTYPPQNLFNKWLRVGYLEKQGIVFIDEENDKNYIFYKNTEATFEMKWPSSKLIDKENSICFVCRIPDRQWRQVGDALAVAAVQSLKRGEAGQWGQVGDALAIAAVQSLKRAEA